MAAFFSRLAKQAQTMATTAVYELSVEAVALRYGVAATELRRRCQRRPELVSLKRQALYLAVMGGHSRRSVATVSRQSPEAVARACRDVEELRDDPELDRLLDELELRMRPRNEA